jgi:uncharacterized protein YjbJ (UPF0337 family)
MTDQAKERVSDAANDQIDNKPSQAEGERDQMSEGAEHNTGETKGKAGDATRKLTDQDS